MMIAVVANVHITSADRARAVLDVQINPFEGRPSRPTISHDRSILIFQVCRCVMPTAHHSIITAFKGKTILAFRRIVHNKPTVSLLMIPLVYCHIKIFPGTRIDPPHRQTSSLMVWQGYRQGATPLFPAIGVPRLGRKGFPMSFQGGDAMIRRRKAARRAGSASCGTV